MVFFFYIYIDRSPWRGARVGTQRTKRPWSPWLEPMSRQPRTHKCMLSLYIYRGETLPRVWSKLALEIIPIIPLKKEYHPYAC